MFVVGDWVKFDYTNRDGVARSWVGEIRKQLSDGFLVNTRDGFKRFKSVRIENMSIVE
jgi:hypothetical protein